MEIVNYILSEALRNGKLSATLNAEGMKYKDVLCVFGSVNDNVFTLSIEGLKFIVAGAGIIKTITSHVARHTYGTYLINNGISILTVSKALGHSNTRMSEHYAKLLAKTVIDEMSTLIK